MTWRARLPLRVFARGASLRRRVAYSLATVRLILVPVILLAVYYMFAMGWIVDRIVTEDAPVATFAERASIEMLDARRAERNYFLLHDQDDLDANHQAISNLEQIIATCGDLQPAERATTDEMLFQVREYRRQFQVAVARLGEPSAAPLDRMHSAVEAYEHDLNELLRRARHESRAHLIDELRNEVGSFDAQITATLETEDPGLREATTGLQKSSDAVLKLAPALETRSWNRVRDDQQEARALIRRAEWVGGIVSVLTFLLSVLVSFVLPRQVVKPLVDLRQAVDHAASGNYEIEFNVEGKGELVDLANSVRSLIAHVREKRNGNHTPPEPGRP